MKPNEKTQVTDVKMGANEELQIIINKVNEMIAELEKMEVAIRDDDNMDWKLKEIKLSEEENCCVFYCEEVK